MGTKQALQFRKPKKLDMYFYIVDTWLSNCFFVFVFLTSTLHLPHVAILTQGRNTYVQIYSIC